MTKCLRSGSSISQTSGCHIFVIILEWNFYTLSFFIKMIDVTNSLFCREGNLHWKVWFYSLFCLCNRKTQKVLHYWSFLSCSTITTLFYRCVLERKSRKEACHGKQRTELLIPSYERCHSLELPALHSKLFWS